MIKIIDCKGLKCPKPIINTKKYFDSIEEGEAQVIVDNEVAKNNVLKFCNSNGYVSNVDIKEEMFYITIIKNKSNECKECSDFNIDNKKFVIVISKDKLGEGNDDLGKILIKSYIFTLSESTDIPTDLIFLNSGVKLTTEGSEVIESIEKLREMGTNIINCGTCLDFYGLKDKLKVGEISNMYTIVEKMNSADKTIQI